MFIVLDMMHAVNREMENVALLSVDFYLWKMENTTQYGTNPRCCC